MVGAHRPRRRLGAPVFAAVLALAATAFVGGAAPGAGAATTHRAAVIVDTGGDVHKVVITFGEDSITGIDALQRAGANPVVYNYNGQGGAVCRLFGVGRDSGPNCLGGQDGDNRYWAYFRAPVGSSSFTYSSVGAGTTRVHDGDVEGWKFGTGAAPAFVSLASLVPPPPPPATSPATRPASTGSGSVGSGSTGGGSVGGSTESAAVPGAVAGAAPGGPTSSSTLPVTGASSRATAGSNADRAAAGTKRDAKSGDGGSGDGSSHRTALASSTADGGGSSASLIWLAVALAAIAIAVVVIRRVRRRPVP